MQRSIMIVLSVLAAACASARPSLAASTVDQTQCAALNQAEGTSMWDYVDRTNLTTCTVDSDCVTASITAYSCDIVVNTTSMAAAQAYEAGVVYQTLEAKFQELGCRRYPPPCPYPGTAACQTGQCRGVFP